MRYILVLLVPVFLFPSCKKKSQNATVTPVVNNNISSVRKRLEYRPVQTQILHPYVTWSFTGSNPLTVTPDTDTSYFRQIMLSLTGENLTAINCYSPVFKYIYNTEISYKTSSLPDTIIFTPMGYPNRVKLTYEYELSHATVATLAHALNATDTTSWFVTDKYYYTYSGNNIVKTVYAYYTGSSVFDTTIYAYYPGNKANNLANSSTARWALEFLGRENNINNIPIHSPLYTNPDILDSISIIGYKSRYTTEFITTTDKSGRIVQQIANPGPTNKPDTVFYTY